MKTARNSLALLAIFTILFLSVYWILVKGNFQNSTYRIKNGKEIGSIIANNCEGNFSMRDNITFISFGYIGCQSACPQLLQRMEKFSSWYIGNTATNKKKITYWMIDIAEKKIDKKGLEAFMKSKFLDFQFIQCPNKSLFSLTSRSEIQVSKNVFSQSSEKYNHTNHIFGIDRSGKIILRIPFGNLNKEQLSSDLLSEID